MSAFNYRNSVTDTPIGGYCLLSSSNPDVVQRDGKTFLKSGVLAKASDYPNAPAEYLGVPNPVRIGSGSRHVSIAVDDLGYPWVLCAHPSKSGLNGDPGNMVKIVGLSQTKTVDTITYAHTCGSTANQPGQDALKIHFWQRGVITTASDVWGGQGGYNSSFNNFTLYENISLTTSGSPTALGNATSGANIRILASNSTTLVGIQRNFNDAATTSAFNSTTPGTCTARTLPSATWTSCAWSATPAVFVAVATGGTTAASSADGATWTARTLPTSANWSSICASNTRFVAVASGGTAAAYSDNGTTTWTASTLPTTANWSAVGFGNGLFLAVARDSNIAATSTDGITWTQRTLPFTADWCDVVWSPRLSAWFAVANDGRGGVIYSADGITWFTKAFPHFIVWGRLWSMGGSNMFAYAYQACGPVTAKSTDNGVTWKYYKPWMSHAAGHYTAPTNTQIEWVNNRFVGAYGANVSAYYVWHSTDGVTWTGPVTAATPVNMKEINHVGFTNGQYLFAFYSYDYSTNYLDSPYIGASSDLTTFSLKTMGVSYSWRALFNVTGNKILAYGVTLANNAAVWRYSADGNTWSAPTGIGPTTRYLTGAPAVVYNAATTKTIISSSAASPSTEMAVSFDDGASAASWIGTAPPEVQLSDTVPCSNRRVSFARGGGSTVTVWNAEGDTIVASYTSAHAFATNAIGAFYARPVQHNSNWYVLSSNANFMFQISTELWVDNLKVGNESSGALNYYMRVA